MSLSTHAITFLSGFANEAVAVFWVHNAEHGRVLGIGLCSTIQAVALIVGIGESVRDKRYRPTFVAGYACGAMAAVVLKGCL
jgi:hypothetical protein